MNNQEVDVLSARITALTIISSQALSLYFMHSKDPESLAKDMNESAKELLAKMRSEIQTEGNKVIDFVYTEARRAAQQP